MIETGFTTSICLAPWTSLKIKSDLQSQLKCNIGSWPLRYLLFKLMFMSGVVKIQADCPTWKHLTALEFHFATQCLPGPLSWYAHQLHPLLLRLSVAVTMLIEIPLTFFLIAPTQTMRSFGAKWQILLQIVIMLTGNYNFFNLLTIALCLLCLETGQGEGHNLTQWDPRVYRKVMYLIFNLHLFLRYLEIFLLINNQVYFSTFIASRQNTWKCYFRLFLLSGLVIKCLD